MSNYILCLFDDPKEVNDIEENNGYSYIDKNNGKVTIYDEVLKEKYIIKKFTSIYSFILRRIEDMFNGEPDDDGVNRSINELDRLESILKGEYIKHLKKEEYDAFLSDIKLVRSTLEEEYAKYKKKSIRR